MMQLDDKIRYWRLKYAEMRIYQVMHEAFLDYEYANIYRKTVKDIENLLNVLENLKWPSQS